MFISVLLNPRVAERDNNVIVKQDEHIELKCLEENNGSGDLVIFSWLVNWILRKNNTNTLVLNKINPEMSGEYICRAQNRAGIYYDAVNITVSGKYKVNCRIYFALIDANQITQYSFLYCPWDCTLALIYIIIYNKRIISTNTVLNEMVMIQTNPAILMRKKNMLR